MSKTLQPLIDKTTVLLEQIDQKEKHVIDLAGSLAIALENESKLLAALTTVWMAKDPRQQHKTIEELARAFPEAKVLSLKIDKTRLAAATAHKMLNNFLDEQGDLFRDATGLDQQLDAYIKSKAAKPEYQTDPRKKAKLLAARGFMEDFGKRFTILKGQQARIAAVLKPA